MNIDLRCLGVGLFALIVVGVAAAVPMDMYRSDKDDGDYAAKRVQSNMWYQALYPRIPPRDARARKTWRASPYDRLSLVDDSVRKFDSQITVCRGKQVCKQAEKSSFKCRCPGFTQCVAAGRKYDASCKYSNIGVVYHQPRY